MFYEILSDGTIGRSTENATIANQLGLTLQTNKKIVYAGDGRRYFFDNVPAPAEESYIQKRQRAYPDITDQLDMIYWDKVNATDNWQQAIAAVKQQYPKE